MEKETVNRLIQDLWEHLFNGYCVKDVATISHSNFEVEMNLLKKRLNLEAKD